MEKEKLIEVKENVDEMSKTVEKLVDDIVNGYTHTLDELMKDVYTNVISVEEPTIEILEKYFMELSNAVYYIGSQVEKLSVYDGVSKISYKEVYNNYFMNPTIDKPKPTVGDITAYSENNSVNELVISDMYNKAYKMVKAKVGYAETMISTLSKCISRRLEEMKLSSTQPSSVDFQETDKQILNEIYSN